MPNSIKKYSKPASAVDNRNKAIVATPQANMILNIEKKGIEKESCFLKNAKTKIVTAKSSIT